MTAGPEKIATQLLRLSRDPDQGTLIGGHRLAVCLRAAVFSDLILAGRIGSTKGAPRATLTGRTDHPDRLLDAVENAVIGRPRVPWWRWFRHVDVDLTALLTELTTDGCWRQTGKAAWADEQAEHTRQLGTHLLAVQRRREPPQSAGEGTLAYLLELIGASTPRDLPSTWAPVLMPLVSDPPAREALSECLTVVARVHRGRLTGALRH